MEVVKTDAAESVAESMLKPVADRSSRSAEKLLRTLAFTLVFSVMSATMFNIALSEIRAEFELTVAQVSWVSSAYMLVYAIGAVVYGKLADAFKLKNLLTVGLTVMAAGSLVALMTQTYGWLLSGRVLQAAGAAVIPAIAMLIPVRYFPPERRGRALGISASGMALGTALGPLVAAFVVSLFHWKWLFLVPLATLFALPSYRKHLTDELGAGKGIDWLGGLLLAGATGLLLLAVTHLSWSLAAGGILCLGLLAVRVGTARVPFIEPDMFRNATYSLSLTFIFLVAGFGFALVFLPPLLFANVNGLDTGAIGLSMVPAALGQALLGRRGGMLADRKGNSFLFYIASLLFVIGFIGLSSVAGGSVLSFAAFLILGNVGQLFLRIALSNTVSQVLPPEQTGVAMGLVSMLSLMAGAMAAAVFGTLLDVAAALPWNPLVRESEAAPYSNIFLVLAVLHVGVFITYRFHFRTIRATGRKSVAVR